MATDGEKKDSCMNLEFVSPGLIIINWINPTQTHYTSKVAVDIWVLCLQHKKKCFILHSVTSFHLAPSVPVNYFCWLHTKKIPKTEYGQWRWGLNNVIFAPTSNSRDKKQKAQCPKYRSVSSRNLHNLYSQNAVHMYFRNIIPHIIKIC